MPRVMEGTPGQEVEVWVQDKGAASPRLRGKVVIEDLSDVLTCISSRTGANGPMNPVTQYILAQAAQHLADRLLEDPLPDKDGRETVPRTLSGALGHQPFIESVLGMSQHQMLRRWPLANDWYNDVVSYVMRPARFEAPARITAASFDEWTKGSFGDFIRKITDNVFVAHENPKILRLAEALQSMWPEYAPIKDAMSDYRRQVNESWAPFYTAALGIYGLRVREGISIFELAWTINAIQARETLERLWDRDMPLHAMPDGSMWNLTARAALLVVAGATTDLDGNMLTFTDITDRMPVASAPARV